MPALAESQVARAPLTTPIIKTLPKERFGSASAVHKRFLEWEAAGFFEALWQAGLAEYDDMAGIAWRWQSVDGAIMKAPWAVAAAQFADLIMLDGG